MKKGFTLLELLIVVVIIGVLALIAAPALLNTTDQAKEGAVKANVTAAASSVTSRFALETENSAEEIAAAVIEALAEENTNPIDSENAAFADAAAAGTVVLAADDDTQTITITGYDKDTEELISKVVTGLHD